MAQTSVERGAYLSLSGLSYLISKLRAEYTQVAQGTGITVTQTKTNAANGVDEYTVALSTQTQQDIATGAKAITKIVGAADADSYDLTITGGESGQQSPISIGALNVAGNKAGVITPTFAKTLVDEVSVDGDSANGVNISVKTVNGKAVKKELPVASADQYGVMSPEYVQNLTAAKDYADDHGNALNLTIGSNVFDAYDSRAVKNWDFKLEYTSTTVQDDSGVSADRKKKTAAIKLIASNGTKTAESSIDVTDFIIDGMMQSAALVDLSLSEAQAINQNWVAGPYLKLTFNVANEEGKTVVYVPVEKLFNNLATKVKLSTGYTKATKFTPENIKAGATVETAIAELHKGIEEAKEAGVTSFGAKTGAITLATPHAPGKVDFIMKDNELQGTTKIDVNGYSVDTIMFDVDNETEGAVKFTSADGSISAVVNSVVGESNFISKDEIDGFFPKATV